MKIKVFCLATICCLLIFVCNMTCAQNIRKAERYYDEAMSLYKNCDFLAAASLFKTSAEIVTKLGNNSTYAVWSEDFEARCLYLSGNKEAATKVSCYYEYDIPDMRDYPRIISDFSTVYQLIKRGDANRAVDLLISCSEYIKDTFSDNSFLFSFCQSRLSSLYLSNHEFVKAQSLIDSAISFAESRGNYSEAVEYYLIKLFILTNQDGFEVARTYYENNILPHIEQLTERSRAEAHYAGGMIYDGLGERQAAEEKFRLFLESCDRSRIENEDYINALRLFYKTLYLNGNLEDAKKYSAQTLAEIAGQKKGKTSSLRYIETLIDYAMINYDLSNFVDCYKALYDALPNLVKVKNIDINEPDTLQSLIVISDSFLHMYETGVIPFDKNFLLYIHSWKNLVEEFCRKMANIKLNPELNFSVPIFLQNAYQIFAFCSLNLGNFEEALEELDRSVSYFQDEQDIPLRIYNYYLSCHLFLHNYSKAYEYSVKMKPYDEDTPNNLALYAHLICLGGGAFEEALQLEKASYNEFLNQYWDTMLDEEHSAMVTTNNLAECCFQYILFPSSYSGDDVSPYNIGLNASILRKNGKYNKLQSISNFVEQSGDDDLYVRFVDYKFNSLNPVYGFIEKYGESSVSQTDKTLAYVRKSIENQRSFIEEIKQMGYTFNESICDVQTLSSSLSDNAICVDFTICPNLYPSKSDTHNSESRWCIATYILKSGWNSPKYFSIPIAGEINNYLLSELWTKVIEMSHANPGDDLYFCPDSYMCQYPIEHVALLESGAILSDIYKVHRVSSLQELCRKHESSTFTRIALFGGMNYDLSLSMSKEFSDTYNFVYKIDYGLLHPNDIENLPETREEINAISSIFHSFGFHDEQVCAKVGDDATELNFSQLSGDSPSIIHIATHGFYFPVWNEASVDYFTPSSLPKDLVSFAENRSFLLFSGAKQSIASKTSMDCKNDGFLSAAEIINLNLSNTDLVVLSACESGLGDYDSYEGGMLNGVQQAFKIAGANSILVSLRNVDDINTRKFMCQFYSALLSGSSKIEALRHAQHSMKEISPDWDAFILIDAL